MLYSIALSLSLFASCFCFQKRRATYFRAARRPGTALEVVDGLVGFDLILAVDLLQLVIEFYDGRMVGTQLVLSFGNLDSES
jgi:hypothetical protein